MVTLHVYMRARDPLALEETYREVFAPAMARQRGFVATRLLRAFDSADRYGIEICFQSEAERQAWVASADHALAWPRIEALCEDITWQGYDVLAAVESPGPPGRD